ncbi:MAG: hypothetical protein A2509_08110 [Candidatus Edwardsbacteria bacterium RIFOXYD12_FULL_50_11]|uniref:Uncharacterized protein n=1 Tax=Candidatus Edwardsbacteria bacterium GWF2_54_11 TaxID=1817851 RepID=A0A1F5QY56_9BACT|nr:MAG: hypothetical protein A2502_12005 [Candidatus Edwardsbacteria bacterium RifOxyC12_full_54_24]OGF06632.1 MAG: hypothetical protein A2273_12150 [Candidatus Edwardsbacteria bacterium RifOxyA12_full_54_48]OGF07158.1 MAG: hypothetical protein A2024_05230 [Candidatus Edwardsbacteria bacterium GWF2_54_11]OGF11665.1 MAG: hypothetical protein A3K15_04940 [Candidatus Edwardsbacteria bacterium GWE2_54_12]OGF17949.1 MAG: hypothetical protein A2509_08110 [Candidatus Edwardsbacteria bacterium RIFOXYD1
MLEQPYLFKIVVTDFDCIKSVVTCPFAKTAASVLTIFGLNITYSSAPEAALNMLLVNSTNSAVEKNLNDFIGVFFLLEG